MTTTTTTTKKKLTQTQRQDLLRAAQHPDGLFSQARPNRTHADNLRYAQLLEHGPAVLERDRPGAVAEALEFLQLARQQAEAGEFCEAENEAWGALHTFKRLHATRHYITEAGRKAAASGFYMEREW